MDNVDSGLDLKIYKIGVGGIFPVARNIYIVVVFACDDGQHWSLLIGICCFKAYMGIVVLCLEQVYW